MVRSQRNNGFTGFQKGIEILMDNIKIIDVKVDKCSFTFFEVYCTIFI